MPIPKADGELQVTGLYRYVRHPMYDGVIIIALGLSLSSNHWIDYLFTGLLILLFMYKSNFEEKLLLEKYPVYKKYMQNTPAFLPKIH
jgi:protein-S-isoprenylcysteine O-methyltransferase Ste14